MAWWTPVIEEAFELVLIDLEEGIVPDLADVAEAYVKFDEVIQGGMKNEA